MKVNFIQKKKLIYVKDLLPIIFKTFKNKKAFNIINVKGKTYNISKLWKNINETLFNKHKSISKNNAYYNFIETLMWYKHNLFVIKKEAKKYHKTI